MLRLTLALAFGSLAVADGQRRMAPAYGGVTGGTRGAAYGGIGTVAGEMVDHVRDVSGLPLDGTLVPVDPVDIEDLTGYAGKCHATVNLIQVVPNGTYLDPAKFAHIKRMVHFMLDGFVLHENRSHAGVLTCGSECGTLFSCAEKSGRSNVEARRHTANMTQYGTSCNMTNAFTQVAAQMNADLRPEAVNVVIIHTDGVFEENELLSYSTNVSEVAALPRMIPIVVSYGDGLFQNQNALRALVEFAECLDLEFCPNLIPAKWSASSLISTQLAVKQYIQTAVRAIPRQPTLTPDVAAY